MNYLNVAAGGPAPDGKRRLDQWRRPDAAGVAAQLARTPSGRGQPAAEGGHLVAMPVYEPGFTPLAIFDGSFRSSLQRIMRSKRKLSATATAYQVVVGGVSDKVAQFDLGQGVGDLHPLDFSCFYFNLQRDVSRRLAAFVCRRDGPRAAL